MYNWKTSTNRNLTIINLFQLATSKEKLTSSGCDHTMEKKKFINYKNILLMDSYSFGDIDEMKMNERLM